jgi:hypothetical protein
MSRHHSSGQLGAPKQRCLQRAAMVLMQKGCMPAGMPSQGCEAAWELACGCIPCSHSVCSLHCSTLSAARAHSNTCMHQGSISHMHKSEYTAARSECVTDPLWCAVVHKGAGGVPKHLGHNDCSHAGSC